MITNHTSQPSTPANTPRRGEKYVPDRKVLTARSQFVPLPQINTQIKRLLRARRSQIQRFVVLVRRSDRVFPLRQEGEGTGGRVRGVLQFFLEGDPAGVGAWLGVPTATLRQYDMTGK